MIWSVLASASRYASRPLIAHILTDSDPTPEVRQVFSVSLPKAEVDWITLDRGDLKSLPPGDADMNPITYGRLFGPGLLPLGVHRAIYLDADVLVRDDLAKLYSIDLGGKTLAAARDQFVLWVGHPWYGLNSFRTLGLDARDAYFNSGVMVIDVDRWIELEYEQKCLDYLRQNDYLRYHDQDVLNVCLIGDWVELSPAWNLFAYLEWEFIEMVIGSDAWRRAKESPAIVHYVGDSHFKPWNVRVEDEEKPLYFDEWRAIAEANPFKKYLTD